MKNIIMLLTIILLAGCEIEQPEPLAKSVEQTYDIHIVCIHGVEYAIYDRDGYRQAAGGMSVLYNTNSSVRLCDE